MVLKLLSNFKISFTWIAWAIGHLQGNTNQLSTRPIRACWSFQCSSSHFLRVECKNWKKASLHVRNSASIGKCRQINTHRELFNMNTLHICSKHAPDFLFSAFRTAYRSHMPSHEPATRPTHTSTFYHGWLPVAPHKLPIHIVFTNCGSQCIPILFNPIMCFHTLTIIPNFSWIHEPCRHQHT